MDTGTGPDASTSTSATTIKTTTQTDLGNKSNSNNKIENFKELDKLASLGNLAELLLVGNPLHASAEKPEELGCEYRIEVLKRVPQLVKLDGIPVDVDEREAAKKALEEAAAE